MTTESSENGAITLFRMNFSEYVHGGPKKYATAKWSKNRIKSYQSRWI